MQRSRATYITLPAAVAFLLFVLLMVSVSACRALANFSPFNQSLPHLQSLIEVTTPEAIGIVPGKFAYVIDWQNNAIAVLDGSQRVALLAGPGERALSGEIAIQPETEHVYVTDGINDNLIIIHGTNIVTTLANIGDSPTAIAVHPTTGLVYVTNNLMKTGDAAAGSSVVIINGTEIITTFGTGVGPRVITADPTSSKVYVGQTLILEVPRPNQELLTVIDKLDVVTSTSFNYRDEYPGYDGSINDIAVDENSGEVYMIQNLGTVIYWHDNQYKRLKLGEMGHTGLHSIAIDSNRGLAYISSWGDPASHVVVLQHGEFITATRVGKDPRQVVYDETHDYVYVANRLSGTMSVIRGTEVVTTLRTNGQGPWYIGVDEPRGYIYVSNTDGNSVAVFSFETPVAENPFWRFLPLIEKQ